MHKGEAALLGLESDSGMGIDYSILALTPRSKDASHGQSNHWSSRTTRTPLRINVNSKVIKLRVRGTSFGINTSLKEMNEDVCDLLLV